VYQVVKVESSFTNGQFIQTLTCVRLNNQSGLGAEVAKIVAGAGSKFEKAITGEDDLKKDNGTPDAFGTGDDNTGPGVSP